MIDETRPTIVRPIYGELAARCVRLIRRAFGYAAVGLSVEGMVDRGRRPPLPGEPRPDRRPGRSPDRRLAWRRATAALEFALASPMLVVLLGGAADYGLAQFYRTNLANAVAAGCEYAYLTAQTAGLSAVTSANIQTIIQDAMFLPAGATANLSVVVTGPTGYCVTGTAPTMRLLSDGGTCSDGSTAGTYVLITATYTNTGLMHGFMAATSQPITESATVRLH